MLIKMFSVSAALRFAVSSLNEIQMKEKWDINIPNNTQQSHVTVSDG